MLLRRYIFAIALGTSLTPLAGYLGVLMMPSAIVLWFLASITALISFNLKALAISLLMPAVIGASYAWPVMILVLPLAIVIKGRTGGLAPFYCLLIGAGAGLLSVYSQSQSDFAISATFAGAILGAAFGYGMWRFDRRAPPVTEEAGTLRFADDWKLPLMLSGSFIVLGVGYLTLRKVETPKNPLRECEQMAADFQPTGKRLLKCNEAVNRMMLDVQP